MSIFNPLLESDLDDIETGEEIEVDVMEGYDMGAGIANTLIDNVSNDFAMFEAAIKSDFIETTLNESEAIESLNEATAKGFMDAIIRALKSFRDKLLSILESAKNKFQNIIIRDNKKYVDKYWKSVESKRDMLANNLRIQWSPCKDNKDSGVIHKNVLGAIDKLEASIKKESKGLLKVAISQSGTGTLKSINTPEAKVALLKDIFKMQYTMDWKSASSDVMSYLYEGKTTVVGLNRGLLDNIKSFLTGDQTVKSIKTLQKKTKKVWDETIKECKSFGDKLEAEKKDKGRAIKTYQEGAATLKEANLKAVSIILSVFKMKTSESRAVFARAVAFGGSKLNESDVDIEINIDSEDEDVADVMDADVDQAVEEAFYGEIYS